MAGACPQCGNRNEDDKKFCTACGHPLAAVSAKTPASPLPGPDAAETTMDRGWFRIVLAGLIVVVILGAGIVVIKPVFFPSSLPPVAVQTVMPVTTPSVAVLTPRAAETTLPATPSATVNETTPPTPTPSRAVTCPSDRRACGDLCADTLNDPVNCGSCGITCDFSQICQQGICRDWCPPGQTSCPDGCHDLLYDTANCGICGNLCPAGLACNRSTCMPPLATAIPTYAG